MKFIDSDSLLKTLPSRDMMSTCVMVDGSKYYGQFLKSSKIKDGIGHIIYHDGSLFEGIFK